LVGNIAVIGCGYWGKNLVRNFAGLRALNTICDTEPQKLKDFTSLYPRANIETDYQQVLCNSEVKGVVIATPAAFHYSMAREALLAGKDVFVEKPLALKVEEGKELVALAEGKSQILMVGHLLEYHPAVVKLKELIDKGELGKIRYIYSNRLNLGKFRTEENILWSFAPHDISVMLLLLGEMPQEVSAHGGYYLHQDVADVTLTTMSFRDGTRAHIFVSWLHPFKEQRFVVVGDKKMAEFNDLNARDKLHVYGHKIEWIERLPVARPEEAEVVEVSLEEPLRIECQNFLECMQNRGKPMVDGYKGLQVLQVLSCCQKSLEQNGKVIPFGNRTEFFVHETSILERPYEIGDGTKIWHFSHIMPDVTIGKDCTIGQNVFIGKGVKIGDNVKIENNVSVFEGVTLEDSVFCGPSCVFTNVVNPRSRVPRRHEFKPTLVKHSATIGANATIICGNTIGRYAFVGAGSVVTRDVPDYALVYGNPAQIRGWVCECGEKLDFNQDSEALCHACGKGYTKRGDKKSEVERIDIDKYSAG
jgi:UDP-2-acetamido-3-amino-2,3-dideoxy-glucuronate N-acetyltransferase